MNIIFGGSFDPIHNGHIKLIQSIQKRFSESTIHITPTYQNRLKKHKASSIHDRIRMIQIATGHVPNLKLWLYEAKKNTPSRTIDTIEHFQSTIDTKPYFLLGMDSFASLKSWYRCDELIHKTNWIVCNRAKQADQVPTTLQKFTHITTSETSTGFLLNKNTRVIAHTFDSPPISSTFIRTHPNKITPQLIPAPVIEYIKKQKLYTDDR